MKNRAYQWWVGSAVSGNEMIAQWFAERGISETEALTRDVLCKDGEKRTLWRIDPQDVKHFVSARKTFPAAHVELCVQHRAVSKPELAAWLYQTKTKKKARRRKSLPAYV